MHRLNLDWLVATQEPDSPFSLDSYEVGDHISILPQNDVGSVSAFMRFYDLDPTASLTITPILEGAYLRFQRLAGRNQEFTHGGLSLQVCRR
jgi:sulfite reductase alpha subunit-like flavoprotein